jgi:hypothetical protein
VRAAAASWCRFFVHVGTYRGRARASTCCPAGDARRGVRKLCGSRVCGGLTCVAASRVRVRRRAGQDIRTQNVTACLAISNIVKSTLGPVGLDKMLVRVRVLPHVRGGARGRRAAVAAAARARCHSPPLYYGVCVLSACARRWSTAVVTLCVVATVRCWRGVVARWTTLAR